jgi:hypothetical protein
VRLRLEGNISDERDPRPADNLAGGFDHDPDYDTDELAY